MTSAIILVTAPALAWFFGANPLLVVLVFALVGFVLFVRWGTRSIPHAIVFVIVFPILLMITFAALTLYHPDSERPQHVERAER